ncbi:MAG: acyltransferase [Chlorobium sp.]|nr:acyltransferase [Chlorobium sp.]
MNPFRDIANIMLWLLPTSKCFALKRVLLKLVEVDIGKDAKINGHTWFYGRGKVRIGDRTWIGPGCKFHSTYGTTIDVGADCDVAPSVMFVTGTHKIGTLERRAGEGYAQDITIGNGCWLGTRVTVLGNVTIGPGSFIAAGSLVNSDVPVSSLAAGVPAKIKRTFEN